MATWQRRPAVDHLYGSTGAEWTQRVHFTFLGSPLNLNPNLNLNPPLVLED
ncbi:MAG: hypothetical protein ABSG04_13170 [Verrucomicrobiota bacterium]